MSIVSSICADISNRIRASWIKELQEAEKEKDWAKIQAIIIKMIENPFSE